VSGQARKRGRGPRQEQADPHRGSETGGTGLARLRATGCERRMIVRGCGALPGLRRGWPEFSVSRSSATALGEASMDASPAIDSECRGTVRPRRAIHPAATPSGSASHRHGPPVSAAFALPLRDLPGGSTPSMSEPRTTRTVEADAATGRSRREGRSPLLRVLVGSSRVQEDFPHGGPRRRFTRLEPSRRTRTRSLLPALDTASQMCDATFGRQSEASTSLRHTSGYIFNLRSTLPRVNPFRSLAVVSCLPNGG
jgi:hypothetical protein